MRIKHYRDPDTGVIAVPKEPLKRDKQAVYTVVEAKQINVFKAYLIRWIVCCQLAFFMLENSVFRELIIWLNAALGALLPAARSTLRRWIIAEYEERKEVLKAELQASFSSIHISFDIWTAGNFRRIYRSHSGDNQAAIILDVLNEYEITTKAGYFVCDNASSNDAAVAKVLTALNPDVSAAEITARRLRCIGHIIHLSARSLLDPSRSELVIAAEELELDDLTKDRDGEGWASTGSLGKLHRLVKYILASPQRREEFGEIKGGRKVMEFDHLGLLIDNATRWNSVHRMLDRAITLKERLTRFVRTHKPDTDAYYPQKDRITTTDWIFIERLRDALRSFEAATLQTQGCKPILSDWFQTLHWLLNEIDRWRVDALEEQDDERLSLCFGTSWRKIEKYYKLVDDTPVYYAAIILHPGLKIRKLQEMWHTDETAPWVSEVVEKVKAIWRRQYKPTSQRPRIATLKLYDDDTPAGRLANAKRLRLDTPYQPEDVLEAYLSTPPEPFDDDNGDSVIYWWLDHQHHYPGLAKMAFDVLSIPLMSDNNERSFSSGRDMITYRRTRLRSDIIEACQCLRSWYQLKEELFDSEEAVNKDLDTVDGDTVDTTVD